MSNSSHPLARAISLISIAGLLAGCPAVEPVEPEPPTPASGVWGLHIADVSSSGYCGAIGSAAIGHVLRMDVSADRDGEMELSIFGLDRFETCFFIEEVFDEWLGAVEGLQLI